MSSLEESLFTLLIAVIISFSIILVHLIIRSMPTSRERRIKRINKLRKNLEKEIEVQMCIDKLEEGE